MQSFLKIEKVIGETFHKELQSFKFIAIMITVDLFKIFWFSGIAGMHFFFESPYYGGSVVIIYDIVQKVVPLSRHNFVKLNTFYKKKENL